MVSISKKGNGCTFLLKFWQRTEYEKKETREELCRKRKNIEGTKMGAHRTYLMVQWRINIFFDLFNLSFNNFNDSSQEKRWYPILNIPRPLKLHLIYIFKAYNPPRMLCYFVLKIKSYRYSPCLFACSFGIREPLGYLCIENQTQQKIPVAVIRVFVRFVWCSYSNQRICQLPFHFMRVW